MKVYRYLSEKELYSILSGNKENLGKIFYNLNEKVNNHKYKPNVKYVHFFKNKKSMNKIKELYKNLDENFYFCTFNIPFFHLILNKNYGYYPSKGYIFDAEKETEYIIDIENFNPNWLIDFKKDIKPSNDLVL